MSQPPPPVPPTGNGLATCSLVCGLCGFLTGPLSGIPAIVTGHLAHGRIRRSGGLIQGGAAATAGIILGWITSVLVTFGVVLVALAVPQIKLALERAALADNLNRVKQAWYALDAHATDFHGDYPPNLAAVLGGSATSPVYHVGSIAHIDPKTKAEKDWLYFPGQTQSSPPSNILLAAPDTVDHRGGAGRIVLRIDGSATVIPERDYQRQLRIQSAIP